MINARIVDLPKSLRIHKNWTLFQRPTHSQIRRLSLFRLTNCSFHDGTFERALPGGRGGVKSRVARATYVIHTRVTLGTLARMIGHQIFGRVFEGR